MSIMPRKARIDAPIALNHIIARGINRQAIFSDDTDCALFLERLGDLPIESKTACFARALIPNHFHLLHLTPSVISHAVGRGKTIVEKNAYMMMKE